MIADEWIFQTEQQLPFKATQGQHEAISCFGQFMCDASDKSVMIMRGSAGTGKTSVARAIVGAMLSLRQKVVLMAPTGRAVKVFTAPLTLQNGNRGPAGCTIHRKIYRQHAYMSDRFALADNLHTDTLFIVDEASMISPAPSDGGMFGASSLLDDLIKYVYNGRNCRLMLIGDTAQLPPVGCEEAPALMSDYIAGYGLTVYDYDLREVLRQSAESGILWNATMIRQMITHDDMTELPRIHFDDFADISICNGNELIDQLGTSYGRVGMDETIVVTRSNKRANVFNQGIRNQVLWRDEELSGGDLLMVVKNHYEKTGMSDGSSNTPANTPEMTFIANGDMGVVRRVRHVRELYGFRFADVEIDFDEQSWEGSVILDTLMTEAPALTTQQQEQLFNNIMEDYADIPLKQDRMKAIKQDRHFNALQIKYAYAVTCHKAQGGQWAHVYLDQGYMTDEMLTPSYIHWLYTAFTRATEHLYLVNWPKTQSFTNA